MPPAVASASGRKAAPNKRAPNKRGPKILAALVAGTGLDEIAANEGLSRKRAESALRDELRRRWVAPTEDYARVQITRLEVMMTRLAQKIEDGDLAAVDRMLKILDRLDRYHGFTRASPSGPAYDETARERLLAKLNAMAARMVIAPKVDS
jgi:hypothetical protein